MPVEPTTMDRRAIARRPETARLGSGWHPATKSFDELRGGIELLRAERGRVGRNFEDITLSLRALFQISKTSHIGDGLLFGQNVGRPCCQGHICAGARSLERDFGAHPRPNAGHDHALVL